MKRILPPVLMLVLIGLLTFSRAMSRPEMATVRTVDVVSLTGAGFAVGTAFGVLMMSLKRR